MDVAPRNVNVAVCVRRVLPSRVTTPITFRRQRALSWRYFAVNIKLLKILLTSLLPVTLLVRNVAGDFPRLWVVLQKAVDDLEWRPAGLFLIDLNCDSSRTNDSAVAITKAKNKKTNYMIMKK